MKGFIQVSRQRQYFFSGNWLFKEEMQEPLRPVVLRVSNLSVMNSRDQYTKPVEAFFKKLFRKNKITH